MHKLVRTSLAAAGLVAALALTGCGSDDGDDAGKDSASTAPAEAGSGGDAAKGGSIEGAWSGKTDGKTVDLAVTGTKAVLLADGHACTGDVADMGKQMLTLKCADGNTDRTMGSIESNDGKTLVISWDAGAKDTLTKSATGTLPTGLPTGLPTP
ncbi:hypothetical protein HRW07_19715 [Streptomyces lunaelactis]|uniref:hypothetical protein n=1 Tax=Streptomyces lunaelactis TaxID=1535768 RepID=UPI0015847253|nr:hypothetical protein [Streptomyces lunaelactis]NUL05421.1 hypothetical protein [Streptomyces lunaelactis]